MLLRFTDFDRYKTAVEGWGLEFVQLDKGQLHATVKLINTDRVVVINTTLNRTFHQQGEAPILGRTFGFYTNPWAKAEVRWLDRPFERNTLAVFPADRAYEAYSQPGKDVMAVSVDQRLLEDTAEIAGLQKALETLPPLGGIFCCGCTEMISLREAVRLMFQIPPDYGVCLRNKEVEVAYWILRALAGSEGAPERVMLRRSDVAFRRSIEFIKENSAVDLTIPEVCKAANISERALRYAFADKIGSSPKSYLLAVRLNRVRSMLLKANRHNTTVTQLAADGGFWHMGQFAADYRKMFGELPSETLKC